MMSPDVALRAETAELSQYVYWLLFNIPNGDVSLAHAVRAYACPGTAKFCMHFLVVDIIVRH